MATNRTEYMRNWRRRQRASNPHIDRDYMRARMVQLRSGKHVVCEDKRQRPVTGECELCGVVWEHLHYHHWSDNFPAQGIWVCPSCHRGCEFVEKGLVKDYEDLKFEVIFGEGYN